MIRSVLVRIGLRDVGSIPTIITTTKSDLARLCIGPTAAGTKIGKAS